jgi:hypothetical protein
MIEATDPLNPQILQHPPNPPILVMEQITTGQCGCLSVVGYRLDRLEHLGAIMALGEGRLSVDDPAVQEAKRETCASALLACDIHLRNGAGERLYADLLEGLERDDPERGPRSMAEVLEELMLVHLTVGPVQ